MEMFYLVLIKWNLGTAIIPDTYPKEECLQAAQEINKSRYDAICVPAPKKCYAYQAFSNGPVGFPVKVEIPCSIATSKQ